MTNLTAVLIEVRIGPKCDEIYIRFDFTSVFVEGQEGMQRVVCQ
jgi:hypothetical protein